MKISYSAYSTYEQCPLQYKFSYVDKLPRKDSHHLYFGNLVHETLHHMLKDIQVKPLPELLDFYHSSWDDTLFIKNKENPEDWKIKGANIITGFHNKFDPKAQEVLVTEDYFTAPLGDKHVLSGIVDRLDRIIDNSGEPVLEVIDYKTGKLQSQKYIHDNIQLTFYYHAIRSRFPDIKDIKLTLYFLEPAVRQSTFRDAGHVERMQEKVYKTIENIENENFEPRINNLCPWCDFKEICPAYERERARRGWPVPDKDRKATLRQAQGITDKPVQEKGGPSDIAIKMVNKKNKKSSTNSTQESLF